MPNAGNGKVNGTKFWEIGPSPKRQLPTGALSSGVQTPLMHI